MVQALQNTETVSRNRGFTQIDEHLSNFRKLAHQYYYTNIVKRVKFPTLCPVQIPATEFVPLLILRLNQHSLLTHCTC